MQPLVIVYTHYESRYQREGPSSLSSQYNSRRAPGAQGASWEDWVLVVAWTELNSKKPDLGSPDDPKRVLPDAFCRWLLDRQRWDEADAASSWQASGTKSARNFVIRSIDAWPDENLMAALREDVKTLPERKQPRRDGGTDLLAWWILIDRGSIPPEKFTPTLDQVDAYGTSINTRFGFALSQGLRGKGFAVSGPGRLAQKELLAFGRIFEITCSLTSAHFYRDGWHILQVATSYDDSRNLQQPAWRFLHVCVCTYVGTDMLKLQDPELKATGLHVEDLCRRLLKDAHRTLEPAASREDGDEMHLLENTVAGNPSDPASPADEPASGLRLLLDEVLADSPEPARALFQIAYFPPETLSEKDVASIARQFGADASRLSGFMEARSALLDLNMRRAAAYEEKEEYLSVLVEKTVDSLRNSLSAQHIRPDEIEHRIAGWMVQVAPATKRKDLPPLPRNKPVNSPEFLVPWLLDLLWQRRKMRAYALEYGHERLELSSEELDELSGIVGIPADDIRRQIRSVRNRLKALGEKAAGKR